MARELVDATTCDWHAALPDAGRPISAPNQRALENGKEVDLCDSCAWAFDFYYPRRQEVLPLLQPAVLDALYRSARGTDTTRRFPAQLPIPTTEQPAPAPTPKATPKAPAGTRAKRHLGVWKDDVVQVRCPLPHQRGTTRKYWVDLRNRTGHARGHRKGDGTSYTGPDIAFELPPGEKFTHFCTEHQVCAENGGYGFLTAESLTAHLHKSKDWPTSTKEARDAAETRLQAPAA
ncbi:hypothetical protein [Streptomyces sp. NPDC086776]|uniref:hypothetical protein n=1 Tax=Streptomyces sp. NPDC086776 TaxID=3365756 RepID=UPI0038116049